ncbi:hypothetical protein Thena_0073 [Thermodesulfobium narugense DSM 14796]|uniref:Uncharacterized protein n=1 Tax=Thermodesulfobium narugense DSM 14796 TaxID=747365 RepID=M1E5S0_9BACT|nr:hypothetical protein [Thermodesulfobium narugense]AEE13725.1 hypothetical protein Thena_0073 [Thermodesulfobium narugense DSM 14796]
MVLRYTFFRTLSLFIVYLLVFLLFLFGTLDEFGIISAGHFENGFKHFSFAIICFLATIFVFGAIIDLLNTKQIEVYRDRVVKRVKIPFPMQRDKVIYYKRASFLLASMGISFSEAKTFFCWPNKNLIIETSRFKKEDEARFIKFLAQISGRNENEFLRPFETDGTSQKLIKE